MLEVVVRHTLHVACPLGLGSVWENEEEQEQRQEQEQRARPFNRKQSCRRCLYIAVAIYETTAVQQARPWG